MRPDGVHQRRYLEEKTQDPSESLGTCPYGPLVQPRRECPPLCCLAVRVIAGDEVAQQLPDDVAEKLGSSGCAVQTGAQFTEGVESLRGWGGDWK